MSFRLSRSEIAKALPEAWLKVLGEPPDSLGAVTTDSRLASEHGTFVARKGETTDGHDYIVSAFEQGARFFVVEQEWILDASLENFDNCLFIVVVDTTRALGLLARFWRLQLQVPTLAITGSNGKTTCKEMTKTILEHCVGAGTASERSFNNHVGLPETILKASPEDKWLLLEVGMNHAGEIDSLASIAQPDVAAILNIGSAHIGNFESIDGIADAKCEMLAHVRKKCVLKGDDPCLMAGVERADYKGPKVFFGKEDSERIQPFEYQIRDIVSCGEQGTKFKINTIETSVSHLGSHSAYNAAAACALVLAAFPQVSLERACEALKTSASAAMRFNINKIQNVTLINDAYNANPSSMEAALKTTAELAGDKGFTAILGDMLELGSSSEAEHYRLGQLAGECGAKSLIAVGNFANHFLKGAKKAGVEQSFAVATAAEVAEVLFSHAFSEVIVLKASRGVGLEVAFTEIEKRLHALPSSCTS